MIKKGIQKSRKSIICFLPKKPLKIKGIIADNDKANIADQSKMGAYINKHFTNFVSPLVKSKEDSYRYINNIFKDLKRQNKIRPTVFTFRPISVIHTSEALDQLDSSSRVSQVWAQADSVTVRFGHNTESVTNRIGHKNFFPSVSFQIS
jgi:hypothetical protein